MAKYRKFQIDETVYSIVKINDDGSALQVSFYSGKPAIEFYKEELNAWGGRVETTREEFINFYQKVNAMILNEILL